MDESDAEEFDKFVEKCWGKQIKSENKNLIESETKRRGRKPKTV